MWAILGIDGVLFITVVVVDMIIYSTDIPNVYANYSSNIFVGLIIASVVLELIFLRNANQIVSNYLVIKNLGPNSLIILDFYFINFL